MKPTPARAAVLAAVALLAACGDPGAGGLVVEPHALDFGVVLRGEEPARTLTIANRTARAVAVASLQPNCACFAFRGAHRRILPPGESMTIEVVLVSGSVPAEPLRGKHITVVTDLPGGQPVVVPAEGTIVAPWTTQGRQLFVGEVGGEGGATSWTVRLLAAHPYRLTPDPARVRTSDPRHFAVEARSVPEGVEATVTLVPGARGRGRLQVQVLLGVRVEGPGAVDKVYEEVAWLEGAWAPGG
jgi:hypothetical protein